MRRLVLAGVALLMLVPPAGAAEPWRPDVKAAAAYAKTRDTGSITFAVRTRDHLYGSAPSHSAPMASVLKPMLMAAYLRQPSVRGRALRKADLDLLSPMIRRSDNATATAIRNRVGSGGLNAVAHAAGMRCFRAVPMPWGLSRSCAADQARFFFSLERRFPRRHRATALRLLSSIVPSQRWGVARVRPRGWGLYFKGGWGSGTGAVDHQVALLRRGKRRVAVAIFTERSPSHAYGKETLRGVAKRLLRGLGPRSLPR